MYLPFKRINTGTVYGLLIRGRPAWFSNVPPGMEIGLSGYGAVQQITKKQFQGYEISSVSFQALITIDDCVTIVLYSDWYFLIGQFVYPVNGIRKYTCLMINWITINYELIVIECRGNFKNMHIICGITLFVSGQATNFCHEARATLPKSSDFLLFSAGLFLGFAWKWNFHRWTKLMNFNKGLCPSPARRFSPVRYIVRHPIIVG